MGLLETSHNIMISLYVIHVPAVGLGLNVFEEGGRGMYMYIIQNNGQKFLPEENFTFNFAICSH